MIKVLPYGNDLKMISMYCRGDLWSPDTDGLKKDFIRNSSLKLYFNPSAKGGHLNFSSFILHHSF